jgi:hypothetical protein
MATQAQNDYLTAAAGSAPKGGYSADQLLTIGQNTGAIPPTGGAPKQTTADPTVITNQTGIDKAKDMSNNPVITTPRGATQQGDSVVAADGSIVNTPKTVQGTVNNSDGSQDLTYSDGTTEHKPVAGVGTPMVNDDPTGDAAFDKQLNDMKTMSDAATASQIGTIQQIMQTRKTQQEVINKANEAKTQNALLMGGVTGQGSSAQYAPISSQGIVQAQESYGVQQLAILDMQELNLIKEARDAQTTRNFSLMEKKLNQIDEKKKEKAALTTKLNDQMIEQNKKLQNDAYQSNIDSSVADVFSTGVTDPIKIAQALRIKGVNVTQEQIAKTLENIAKANGTDPSKMAADTSEFFRLKAIPGGLPVAILHLPSTAEQLSAYIQMKANNSFSESTTTAINSPIVQSTMQMMGATQDMPVKDAISTLGMDKIVTAIVGQEGGSPKGVVNNPGNIKFVGLPGQTDSGVAAIDGGTFASYPNKVAGIEAVGSLVQKAALKGENLSDFIAKYKGVNVSKSVGYDQAGLLSKTDYNPNNSVDQYAKTYIDSYIKNASMPSASTLFGRTKNPPSLAGVKARADKLYFDATGQALPDIGILKGNKAMVVANNKLLNNLSMQEGTVGKNFKLALENINKNNLNQNSQPINAFLNHIKNMLGDPAVAQYITQNGTLQNEVGSLIAVKNATGTTVADKLASAGLVPKDASEEQQIAILKTLMQEAENGQSTIQELNSELYKNIDPLETEPLNPNRKTEKSAVESLGSDYNAMKTSGIPGSTTYKPSSTDWTVKKA